MKHHSGHFILALLSFFAKRSSAGGFLNSCPSAVSVYHNVLKAGCYTRTKSLDDNELDLDALYCKLWRCSTCRYRTVSSPLASCLTQKQWAWGHADSQLPFVVLTLRSVRGDYYGSSSSCSLSGLTMMCLCGMGAVVIRGQALISVRYYLETFT
jgi:hypothetical protein